LTKQPTSDPTSTTTTPKSASFDPVAIKF
jgi:hypothetical protein